MTAIALKFNAIIFGDFTTFGSQDILKSLAVQGNLDAPNYVVNVNDPPQCYGTDTVPWDQLALAVGGNILSTDTEVHGHWWTAGSGSAIELNSDCNSPATVDKPFPFADIRDDFLYLSQKMASSQPDLVLSSDNALTYSPDISTNCYHTISLYACGETGADCIVGKNQSSPLSILYGQGNWNGPNPGYPNTSKSLLINVAVHNGTTLTISTNKPSQGIFHCNTIWNFYPVYNNGVYLPEGTFTILRHSDILVHLLPA